MCELGFRSVSVSTFVIRMEHFPDFESEDISSLEEALQHDDVDFVRSRSGHDFCVLIPRNRTSSLTSKEWLEGYNLAEYFNAVYRKVTLKF